MSTYGKYFADSVAAELRAEKARRNITEAQIAEKSGIHRVSVSRYLSGVRAIPMATLADLCRALGLDTFELVNKAEIAAKKRAHISSESSPESKE
jgi:transcriptional regulator with XRE-family HTH domain